MLRVPTKPTSPTEMHRLSNTVGELDKKIQQRRDSRTKGPTKSARLRTPGSRFYTKGGNLINGPEKKTKTNEKSVATVVSHSYLI